MDVDAKAISIIHMIPVSWLPKRPYKVLVTAFSRLQRHLTCDFLRLFLSLGTGKYLSYCLDLSSAGFVMFPKIKRAMKGHSFDFEPNLQKAFWKLTSRKSSNHKNHIGIRMSALKGLF